MQAIDYRNAHPVPAGLSPDAASLAEPFAVCLEALSQAGGMQGKTVCVFGDGPFGIILCWLARRQQAAQVLLFGHCLRSIIDRWQNWPPATPDRRRPVEITGVSCSI